jgi:hypothetical protein
MASLVAGTNCLEAWKAACNHLLAKPGTTDTNLIVEITSPEVFQPEWFRKADPRQVSSSGGYNQDVANTIFPLRTWLNSASRPEFYARYLKAHRRGATKSWGTYFGRLIDFGSSRVNQLERALDVLNGWKNEPGTSIVFHFTSAETDRPRPLGGPCLQLCQLHAYDGRIDASVFYRNHDYFNKALPNFVGIGRLLSFMAMQSGRQVGSLTCNSSHAYSSAGKAGLGKLLGLV